MPQLSTVRRWMLRPSLWTCLVAIVAYWDNTALRGSFVYDDAGSLKNNPVVTGTVPLTEIASRDFWGTRMDQPVSHKSFRPLTTLSFRLNWMWSEWRGTVGTDDHTYSFRVVNVVLHGIVTGLVTEASAWVFDTGYSATAIFVPQLLTGLLFALHPVHAEAVSNITSRGELLMSFFFLVAFLSFANFLPTLHQQKQSSLSSSSSRPLTTIVFVYLVPWLCMTLSMFCKEQGASALISLVVYDFVQNHSSVRQFLAMLRGGKRRDKKQQQLKRGGNDNTNDRQAAVAFLIRTGILAVETLLVVALRYWLNGATSPDFIYDQNPAGFSSDRFTRVFSVSWVYCLYIWDAIYPRYLCPDWSGNSIDLIREKTDARIPFVLALWLFTAAIVLSLLLGLPETASRKHQRIRRVILMSFFAFLFSPFLLSSNLLVVVGLMKADRVIYLPLMGFCLLEALLFQSLACQDEIDDDESSNKQSTKKDNPSTDTTKRIMTTSSPACLPGTRITGLGYLMVLTQLFLFSAKVHERNIAWSHSLNLWMSAYQINSRSYHTRYNCGYELSLKKRYQEAEQVLRPLADPRVDGPGNTFVYSMVLYNLDLCDEALTLIDEAMYEVKELRRAGGLRNSDVKLKRAESNLLVARAFCTKDISLAGKIMYDAVQADLTNAYAIEQAQAMVKRVEAQNALMEKRRALGLA